MEHNTNKITLPAWVAKSVLSQNRGLPTFTIFDGVNLYHQLNNSSAELTAFLNGYDIAINRDRVVRLRRQAVLAYLNPLTREFVELELEPSEREN